LNEDNLIIAIRAREKMATSGRKSSSFYLLGRASLRKLAMQ
jgi:hypothetical protein